MNEPAPLAPAGGLHQQQPLPFQDERPNCLPLSVAKLGMSIVECGTQTFERGAPERGLLITIDLPGQAPERPRQEP